MRGRFSEARAWVAQARAILTEFGLTYFLAHSRDVAALVETLAGDRPARKPSCERATKSCGRWVRRPSSRRTRHNSPRRCTHREGTTKRTALYGSARRPVPVARKGRTWGLYARSSSRGEVT